MKDLSLERSPGGQMAAIDIGSARMTFFELDGTVVSETPLPPLFQPSQLLDSPLFGLKVGLPDFASGETRPTFVPMVIDAGSVATRECPTPETPTEESPCQDQLSPEVDRASKPTRLVAAVFLGWLVALGLPVPPAASQETPSRTLRASAVPLITIGPGQGVDSPYELFQVDGAMRLPDGSVAVVVGGHHEVRRFGPDGTHL